MIRKFDVKVTYKNSDEKKIIKYERAGLKEYGFNSNQTMAYFVEKVKSDEPMDLKEHIFWIPTSSIIEMDVDFTSTFETKKEKLEFLASRK